jgi:hypothetical protein
MSVFRALIFLFSVGFNFFIKIILTWRVLGPFINFSIWEITNKIRLGDFLNKTADKLLWLAIFFIKNSIY